MRVLQVDSGREWRGGQNQVRLLCRELVRLGSVDQVLVTQRGGALAERAAADGVTVRGAGWTLGFDPRAVRQVYLVMRELQPAVVHAHDSHALMAALWARRFAARRGLTPPVIATRRVDFHVARSSTWFRADHLIAISDAVKRVLLEDGARPDGITVVPSGIEPDEVRRAAEPPLGIRAQLGLAAGTPLAVNVAALVDHKDQRTLIRAAAGARGPRPDLHWAIAGTGDRRAALAAEIDRLGLADRVHLLGWVERADALIREADVFVMSSKEEGLGTVVLHALALATPVVATRGGGLPEMLPPEALVDVGDAAGLARKVLQTLASTDPALRAPHLPERFTAHAMATGVLALYRSLV